jgi:hypothetical protein
MTTASEASEQKPATRNSIVSQQTNSVRESTGRNYNLKLVDDIEEGDESDEED